MKRFISGMGKRIAGLMLGGAMLFGSAGTVLAQGNSAAPGTVPVHGYMYDQLSNPAKTVYDTLLTGPLAQGPCADSIPVSFDSIPAEERTWQFRYIITREGESYHWDFDEANYGEMSEYSRDAVCNAVQALYLDHPEMSWVEWIDYTWEMGDVLPDPLPAEATADGVSKEYVVDHPLNGVVYRATEKGYGEATMDPEQAIAEGHSEPYCCADTGDSAAMDAALAAAMAEIGDLSGLRVWDKVKAIHDWVCGHVTYKDPAKDYPDAWRGYQTAYIALSDGAAVCAGYSHTMQLLCSVYGIPCVTINGLAGDEWGPHAWNAVQIGRHWYGVDCLWDDGWDGTIRYDYFLKGSKEFGQGHRAYNESADPEAGCLYYPSLASENCDPADAIDPLDIAALQNAVTAGRELLNSSTPSLDGNEVAPGDMWILTPAWQLLRSAVTRAETVLRGNPTRAQLNAACSSVTIMVSACTAARQSGNAK